MNRALQLVALLMALLALSMHGVADAACKVKADDTTGKDADVGSSNKIQDAPAKRLSNKIAFDVVDDEVKRKRLANKIAFDVPTNGTASNEDESTSTDDDSAY